MVTAAPEAPAPLALTIPLDDVVEHFAHIAANAGESLTPLKLQAFCYFAQLRYLGTYGKPLFLEPIEAAAEGPVVPDLERRYGDCTDKVIGPSRPEPPELPLLRQEEMIDLTFATYGGLMEPELATLAAASPPWREACSQERGSAVIAEAAMRRYGRELDELLMSEPRAAVPAGCDPDRAEAESAERIARSIEDAKAGRSRRW